MVRACMMWLSNPAACQQFELDTQSAALSSISVLLLCRLCAAWSALQLQVLDLNSTRVSGSLPAEWGNTVAGNMLGPSLQGLYLHQTQLSGGIPATWLNGMPNVTRFTIWGTNVCGPHPEGGSGLGALCLDTTRTRLGED